VAVRCAACGGTGWRLPPPCPVCRGRGTRTRPRRLAVAIPPGVGPGGQGRGGGEGRAAPAPGGRGEPLLIPRGRPHRGVQREGGPLALRGPSDRARGGAWSPDSDPDP